jgi:hypothetical protein
MDILITAAVDVIKALLPELLQFLSEKANEPTTVEDALPDPARRSRLLAAVRLRRDAGSDGAGH